MPAMQAAPMSQAASAAEAAAGMREALALAAAAAEGKGVELGAKGLAAYAEAIAPDWQKRQGSGEQGGGQRGRQNEQGGQSEAEKKGPTEKAPTERARLQGAPQSAAPLSAGGLREMALASAESEPLLAIMNRLPGRDGRRWIVLPFGFCMGGREFRVSMRILLGGESPGAAWSERMAIDIAESAEGRSGNPDRRWLFSLAPAPAAGSGGAAAAELASAASRSGASLADPAGSIGSGGAGGGTVRIAAYLEPALSPAGERAFAGELARIAGVSPEMVSVGGWGGGFQCESDCLEGILRSVYEAV